ncbi:MAG: efflux RND transporter periplasmic adaptor subunit [Bacteroidia bacterium]|nr:efflux RND transporter periplasmic adaptor subunit [Bacteroidia bacterium]
MRILSYLMAAAVCISVAACGSGAGSGNRHSEEAEEHHEHAEQCEGHTHGTENHHEHGVQCEGHAHEGHHHGEAEAEAHNHTHTEAHSTEAEAHTDSHEGEIVFSQQKQKTFGVVVESIEPEPFAEVVKVGGRILAARSDESVISATTSGIFHFSGKTIAEGSFLSEGTVFAVINTRTADGGDPVSKARAAYETAEKEYLRDTQLLKDNIISQSHFDRSKLEYEQARAAYEALTSSGYGESGLNVNAPANGYVTALYAKEGQYVSTGQTLAVISRGGKLSLRAELPLKYYGILPKLATANFALPGGDLVRLGEHGGRLIGFSRTAEEGFLPVTFEFDSCSSAIPGAYVDVWLLTGESTEALTVPVEAVVESQGIYSVYVQHEDDAFMKRDIVPGGSDGVKVRILSGISPGERVVVKGAMQIKLASVAAAPAGHNHQH